MKRIILILTILSIGKIFSQTDKLFFEQKAFDLYRTKILDSFPVNKKIKIYQHAFDFHDRTYRFKPPTCLGINWKNNEQFKEMSSYNERKIDFDTKLNFFEIDRKKFKVKISKKGGYPIVFISPPYEEKGNEHSIFINIREKHSEKKEYIYHIEFNKTGKIVNWCRSEYFSIVVY